MNGRELTADDVVYSMERFRTVKGNANAYMLASVDKVEAVDKYTVRFTLKEPFVWFLDVLANPMAACIVAKEAVEKFGDLKKWEAVDRHRPLDAGLATGRTWAIPTCAIPRYFVPGLPYIDKIEAVVDEDNASRMAAFLAGKYDLGWENPGTINRVDWVQIKDVLKGRRPNLRTLESPSNVMSHIYMRTDKAPFSDVRVRRAMSMAINRQALIDNTLEGVGAYNPPVPAALKDWAIPFDQLGEGGQWYKHNVAAAKKLLTEAGHPNGFAATLDFTTYGSTVLVDQMQLVLKDLKSVGIEAKLNQKEYGAYISTTFYGKYDSMAFGPQTPFLDPDNFLYGQYYPGETKNHGLINDPVVADMLVRQRRTADPAKRREVIFDIQKYLAKQQYYVQMPSGVYIFVWDAAVKNYSPNLGYDQGGRLTAAWLDR